MRLVVLAVAVVARALAACGRPASPPPAAPPESPAPRVDPEGELETRTRVVIVRHRQELRVCYEDALAKAPDLEGHVMLVVEVGQNGHASHVLEGRREGLNDDVVRCLARVLRSIAFHDGAARTITVRVPLSFSKLSERE